MGTSPVRSLSAQASALAWVGALALYLYPIIAGAATALNDSELARISGAGFAPRGDAPILVQQPQQGQQPQQADANAGGDASLPPPSPVRDTELAPLVFSVLQSSADVLRKRELVLDGVAQSGLRLFNLDNSLSSDVVAAANFFDGSGLSEQSLASAIEVNQINDLAQLHRLQGSLQSSLAGHHYATSVYRFSDSLTQEEWIRSESSLLQQDSHVGASGAQWQVSVDPVNFSSSFNQGASTITFWESPPLYLIAPAGAGYIGTGLFGDKYGAEAYYSGLYVQGPTARVNHLEPFGPGGEDILIDSTVRLGLVDFGYFKITGCVVACATIDQDLGELEILNLFDFLALVDNQIAPNDGVGFTSDGIILEGLGSLYHDDLNLNSGVAMIGSGRVSIVEPATFRSGGQFSFSVDAGLDFTLDLAGIDQLDLFSPWPKQWHFPEGRDQLIDLTIPFTLLDIEAATLDRTFDGVLTVPLGPGPVVAAEQYLDEPPQDESTSLESSLVTRRDLASYNFSESREYTLLTGGVMSGAQTGLLALSEGLLSVSNHSLIQLDDSAQAQISLLNGVNAVSSVAANAVNVSRPPAAVRSLSMRQHNLFVQQR